jgi:hypothetical protein
MAAAQMITSVETCMYDESIQSDRQAMIDSVLGTMGAEGEPPSQEALRIMQNFVSGDISLDQMSEEILAHATRMAHEAHARGFAV